MKTVRYKGINEIECLYLMYILKVDLQRKFEKMMLDEHITNLYAPRILASQTTTDGISNPGFQNEKAQKGVNKDARKSFRKAVKKSQWQSFKVKNYQDPTFQKKDIANHLNNKAKRSQTMGARALEQLWEKGGVDTPIHHVQSVQRTRSSNSEFGRQMLSTNANLIKVRKYKQQIMVFITRRIIFDKCECQYIQSVPPSSHGQHEKSMILVLAPPWEGFPNSIPIHLNSHKLDKNYNSPILKQDS